MPSSSSPSSTPSGFSLSCVGLDWNTELSLKSLLTVLGNRAPGTWLHVADVASADLVLYDPESVLAQALLRRARESQSNKVFVACTNKVGMDGLHLRMPIGPSRLMPILELVASRVQGHHLEAPTGESLCQRLDRALGAAQVLGVVICSASDRGFLLPAQRAMYWPRPLTADELAALLFEGVTVHPFTAQDKTAVQWMATLLPQMVSWDAMLWAIGISTSAGRLLDRLQASTRYRLTRWPDFGVVGRRSADMRCSAMLAQRAFTLGELSRATGIAPATLAGFFNASALCGILKADAQADAQVAPIAMDLPEHSFTGGMIRKLRQVFSLGTR